MFEDDVIYVVRQRRSSEMLGLLATCAGVAGFFCGFSPRLLAGIFGWVLLGGGTIAALLAVLAERLDGRPLGRSVAAILVIGALAFALPYTVLWFGVHYLPAHPDLYPKFPTPTR